MRTATPAPAGVWRVPQAVVVALDGHHSGHLTITDIDHASALLAAAQWLDAHRDYAITSITLASTYSTVALGLPTDSDAITLVVELTRCTRHRAAPRLGPWAHALS